jgi:hypothetical protein
MLAEPAIRKKLPSDPADADWYATAYPTTILNILALPIA